jgi:isopropylmalate/homocitrate/citramalate synthase
MTKNKIIQLAIELEKLKIRDIEANYPSDEEIEIEQNIYNRFINEKQNPYFEDEANIDY